MNITTRVISKIPYFSRIENLLSSIIQIEVGAIILPKKKTFHMKCPSILILHPILLVQQVTSLITNIQLNKIFSILKGFKNKLSSTANWTCGFQCEFDYLWYPFDTQNCFIIFDYYWESVQLRADNVTYTGKKELGKYYFKEIKFCDIDKFGRNGFFIDITFNSPMTAQILTLFLPTGMLLLISQISTLLGSKFAEMVIEVNTTLLLVLTNQ